MKGPALLALDPERAVGKKISLYKDLQKLWRNAADFTA
jgi:hypothetical protein